MRLILESDARMDAAACRAEIPLASLIRRKWVPSRMRKTVGPSEESGTRGDLPISRRHALRLKTHGIMHSPCGGRMHTPDDIPDA
jgi:hypothetical protein